MKKTNQLQYERQESGWTTLQPITTGFYVGAIGFCGMFIIGAILDPRMRLYLTAISIVSFSIFVFVICHAFWFAVQIRFDKAKREIQIQRLRWGRAEYSVSLPFSDIKKFDVEVNESNDARVVVLTHGGERFAASGWEDRDFRWTVEKLNATLNSQD